MNTKRIKEPVKLRAVVDRAEGRLAILEINGTHQITWPLDMLPKGASAGNIFDITISENAFAEKEQRKKIKDLQDKLLGKGKPKD